MNAIYLVVVVAARVHTLRACVYRILTLKTRADLCKHDLSLLSHYICILPVILSPNYGAAPLLNYSSDN